MEADNRNTETTEKETNLENDLPERDLDAAPNASDAKDASDAPEVQEAGEDPLTSDPSLSAEDPSEDPSEDIDELTREVSKLKDDLLRERAEFINYRKRVVQEKVDMESFLMVRVVESMLPVLDAFDQLFSSAAGPESAKEKSEKNLDNFIEGAKLIQKQLVDVFQKYGVEEFNPRGGPFDPGSMEALHSKESDKVSSDTVSQVYQKGYKINERLIRAARVAVLKPLKTGGGKNDKKSEDAHEPRT